MNNVHFKSDKQDWATPSDFYNKVDNIYGPFELDPCSDGTNAKCHKHYTEKENGLAQPWFGKVFVNPPYNQCKQWLEKCVKEKDNCERIVVLIPARTDTKFFHDYCLQAKSIVFIKGRLRFEGAESCAPFPSMLVVFEPGKHKTVMEVMDK